MVDTVDLLDMAHLKGTAKRVEIGPRFDIRLWLVKQKAIARLTKESARRTSRLSTALGLRVNQPGFGRKASSVRLGLLLPCHGGSKYGRRQLP